MEYTLQKYQFTPEGRHYKCLKDDIVVDCITEYPGVEAIYTQAGTRKEYATDFTDAHELLLE